MKKSIFLVLPFLFFSSCSFFRSAPQHTQLEVRQFQTRSYDTRDTKMLMKAMLNVLQDDGFAIKQANLELGLISATREEQVGNSWSVILNKSARWETALVTECTANVSEFGKETRVRVTFSQKTLDNEGASMKIRQIQDPDFYQDFFSKVDKGVFIQKEKL